MVEKDKKCVHQVIRRNATTGDPNKVEVECIKCGVNAEYNLITGEYK
ncbi:hypothetical protein QF028_004380 [Neobacillus sp. B4I6]